MGDELLINFNDSSKMLSFGGPRDVTSSDPGKEMKGLSDLSSSIGTLNTGSKVTSKIQEKCILDNEYDELIPQLSSPIKADQQSSNIENSNLIGLSPFDCVKVNRINTLESSFIVESNPVNLMSPFGCPVKVISNGVDTNLNMQSLVPTGQLLPVQEEFKSTISVDVFDFEVLEKKFDAKCSSDQAQDSSKLKLALQSIPSASNSGSVYSSCGLINDGFLEVNSPAEQVNLSQPGNDSVFEEAQAIAKELSRLASSESEMLSEGIKPETNSIVSNHSDLDDIDLSDMELIGNELDDLLDIDTKENNRNLVEESFRNMRINTPKMDFKNSSELVPVGRAQTTSTSSSLSISPLPLSTERLNLMKLKSSETVSASVKLATLKKNVLTRPTAAAGRGGPMKAFVPLSQIVKNSVSPEGVISANPRIMKMSESSPDFLRPVKTSSGIMSSTPILSKPHNPSRLISSVKNGLNIKGATNLKSNLDAAYTPSGLRSSNTVRSQETGKHTGIARPVATGVTRKASIPSPSVGKRYSSSTSNLRTPVARSSSTGHLPLTPSMSKVNGATNIQAFQSPLRRSNSLSTKLSAGSPKRALKTAPVNSPGKGGTSLDKLMSKFRRVSVSRGMKENVSPGKY